MATYVLIDYVEEGYILDMAFVVEDGSGKADANSYTSVDAANQYFADRGITAWSGTTTEKEQYLVRATDYIEGRFGLLFIGSQKTTTQALSWPRTDAGDFADDVVPIKLQYATMEYALRAKSAALAPDPVLDSTGIVVIKTKQKVGPLETEHKALESGYGSSPLLFKPYPAADMLLRGLVRRATGVIR